MSIAGRMGDLGLDQRKRAARLHALVSAVLLSLVLSACAVTTGQVAPQTLQTAAADPRNGDGLGGTGITDTQTFASNTGDGIGGTGINTGVLGTISGFGSIIVNGMKLEFDRSTDVVSDGRPSALENLRVGQVVLGVAAKRGEQLHLETLDIQHAVSGPISAIDHNAETLTVLGQNVRVNLGGDKAAVANFKTLQTGDIVSISGLRMADGTIIASRVDQQQDDGRILVRGIAAAVSATNVNVGGLDIPLDGAVVSKPETGGRVFASGRMINGAFVPDVITGSNAVPFDASVSNVSVEGYAPHAAGSPTPITIEGITVDGAALPPGTAGGDRVVITGRITGPDHIEASTITKGRTVITIHRARGSLRPAMTRPDATRPERVAPPDRPTMPERPQIERPQDIPIG